MSYSLLKSNQPQHHLSPGRSLRVQALNPGFSEAPGSSEATAPAFHQVLASPAANMLKGIVQTTAPQALRSLS